MMKIGDTVTLSITDVSRGGPGIARLPSGQTVFVAYTLTGDTVRARISEIKRKFARAEILEIINGSPERVEPRCRVFGRCGGCQWQHLPYSLQWQLKLEGVKRTLNVHKVDTQKNIMAYPAQRPWNYRNRVQLHGHKTQLGFYAVRSHDIVDIEKCDIADPVINSALPGIREQGQAHSKPYKVEVEVTPESQVRSIWNDRHAAAGFRQVNNELNLKLRQWIAQQVKQVYRVFDLYGGAANLSADLAAQGMEVHCVDTSVPAPDTANLPANVQFHRSDVLPWLKHQITDLLLQKQPLADRRCLAILDPPRGGLGDEFDAIFDRLERLNVSEVIAVGCKTDTWARDIERLIHRGWSLQHVAVFDFFPQTSHVETVAHLTHDE